jgi:hypothetical protein
MELELWCPYAQKMTIVKAERLPVYTAVGSAVKVTDCLTMNPCPLYRSGRCLVGRRLEGAFY